MGSVCVVLDTGFWSQHSDGLGDRKLSSAGFVPVMLVLP